ncbi:glycerophosphodiester phosphodiesterase family protein [Staphylococcus gallinarum]|uniref:glycerophosphodiester phosphodiesterase family protein n=1 Tax=Staphylococcus gallinarum TaxID=1293 RepID=UPI001E379872|nr:glycerophosphodiester phosphodiesterase family protein [Staphylococcus gallinarum]MCD8901829.1 glycerophosphodiester phosphodiesterase [Staphylococcus gallinarum]
MSKFNKMFKGSFIGLAGIVGSLLFINKYKKKPENLSTHHFYSQTAPYILANRGGSAVRPENTKLAFDNAIAHNIDGFAVGVTLTKDDQVIVFNSTSLDATTNGSGTVSEHTLNEIKKLDAGYYFTDINGQTPYRNHKDATILTLTELLTYYPNAKVNIHLINQSTQQRNHLICEKVNTIINEYNSDNRIVIGSNQGEIIDYFRHHNPNTAIAASKNDMMKGFIHFYLGAGNLFATKAHTFILPIERNGIKFNSPRFIHWLNERNIVPGYCHVNNLDLMNDLVYHGAHTLITDRPDLAERFKLTYK